MSREEEQTQSGDRIGTSRRRFLEAASRIAVYTPPAMLVMSRPSFAEIQKSGGTVTYPKLPFQQQDLSCTSANGPDTKNIIQRFCRIR